MRSARMPIPVITAGSAADRDRGGLATGNQSVLPADASSNPDVSLTSVSCSSVGNCDAVGDYYTGAGNLQGLIAIRRMS